MCREKREMRESRRGSALALSIQLGSTVAMRGFERDVPVASFAWLAGNDAVGIIAGNGQTSVRSVSHAPATC